MKKTIMSVVAVCLAGAALAKEKVLVVCAHPDDSIAMAGTLFLMKDKFEIHVADLTKGQRGGPAADFISGATAARRTVEEENAAALVGSTVHWLGFMDGELYATPEACAAVSNLVAELKPRAIFAMWPIDRTTNQDVTLSFEDAVARLKQAYTEKFQWLDNIIINTY